MASATKPVPAVRAAEIEKIVDFTPERVAAPFFLRVAAFCLDYMILLMLPVVWLMFGKLLSEKTTNISIGATIWIIGIVFFLLNHLLLPMWRGQTVGKMLTGLTIVNVDGMPLTVSHLIRRNLLGYLVTVFTFGIGFLISAFNGSGRALHDLIGGTVVIHGQKKLL
jgi:uncharacterized RDD family membrane protein YckC